MADIDPRDFGRLESDVAALKSTIDAMRADHQRMAGKLDSLLDLANQSRGGLWVGMSIVSALSAFVGWVTHWWRG